MSAHVLGLILATTVVALALGLAAAGYSLWRLSRTVGRQDRILREQEHTLQGLCAGARGLGDSLRAMDKRLRSLQQRLDEADLGEPRQHLYRQAIERARKGADLRELVETFGLEPGEAELVQSLHRRSAAQVN